MAERRAPVWSLARTIPHDTPILTDFDHYQAFAGRDRLLVWERLPAAIEPTEAREFPASRDDLPKACDLLVGKRNRERDRETDQVLAAAGWTVVRRWEHVDPRDVAADVVAAVRGAQR